MINCRRVEGVLSTVLRSAMLCSVLLYSPCSCYSAAKRRNCPPEYFPSHSIRPRTVFSFLRLRAASIRDLHAFPGAVFQPFITVREALGAHPFLTRYFSRSTILCSLLCHPRFSEIFRTLRSRCRLLGGQEEEQTPSTLYYQPGPQFTGLFHCRRAEEMWGCACCNAATTANGSPRSNIGPPNSLPNSL